MSRLGLGLVAWALIAFLYVPILIVILFSFQESSRLALPFDGPSLRWFAAVLNDPSFRAALGNSVKIGLSAALTAMIMATLGGLALTRAEFVLKQPLTTLALAPITLPALFLGIALLSYFARIGLYPSLLTVFLAHLIYVLPYTLMVIRSRLDRFDTSIEDAARDLGATPWQSFWRVTFPLMWPAILAGGILAFALSFDEFLITVFVIGSDSTIPVLIWSRMRRTIDPSVNAAATTLLAVLLTSLGIVAFMLRERARAATRVARSGAVASSAEMEWGEEHDPVSRDARRTADRHVPASS